MCSKLGTHRLKAVVANRAGTVLEVAPTAVLVAVVLLLAWRQQGSVLAKHWLGYATIVPLLLATLALAGSLRRPSLGARVAIGALLGLAGLAAISLLWSPVPALARDEALLTGLYAAVLALTVTTLRTKAGTIAALGVVVAGFAVLTVGTALELRYGSDQISAYRGNSGRLYFPVTYVNAEAATMLIAFWPAIVLAAHRAGSVVLRALALGAAAAMLAGAVLTQSRGGAVALALSVVIVLTVAPSRLRLLLPLAIAALPAVVGFDTLTAPFDSRLEDDAVYTESIRQAAEVVLWAGLAGSLAGLAYALLDRLLPVPRAVLRIARVATLAAVLVGAGAATALFLDRVDDPAAYLDERWEAFKQEPDTDEGESHFQNPGSNRYDFWRVALEEFRADPIVGDGARAYGTAYLRYGTSGETPVRAHSLPLDVLAENGVLGLLLLVCGLSAALLPAVRRRATLPGTALLGAGSYWLIHAVGDWTWTFPVCGISFFVLCGIGAAGDGALLPRRAAVAVAAGAAALAIAFVPPWLAGRYTDLALVKGLPTASSDLDRAKRLDPLSTEPYLIEALLAPRRTDAIRALERAAELEPESARIHFQLGIALLQLGRKEEARTALERARRLYPSDPAIAAALRQAR